MTYVFSLAKDHIFDKGNRIRHLITWFLRFVNQNELQLS
jgi:prophage maintenance system killer protein